MNLRIKLFCNMVTIELGDGRKIGAMEQTYFDHLKMRGEVRIPHARSPCFDPYLSSFPVGLLFRGTCTTRCLQLRISYQLIFNVTLLLGFGGSCRL